MHKTTKLKYQSTKILLYKTNCTFLILYKFLFYTTYMIDLNVKSLIIAPYYFY